MELSDSDNHFDNKIIQIATSSTATSKNWGWLVE